MKIIYISHALNLLGGLQKIAIVKANELSRRGHDVTLLVFGQNDEGFMPEPISPEVKYVNLDLWNKLGRFGTFWRRLLLGRRLIKQYIKEHKPDIVVSLGDTDRLILPTIRHRGVKFVREIHMQSIFNLIENPKGPHRYLASLKNFIDYWLLGCRWDRVVLLSEHDLKEDWRGWKKNVIVIPNPLPISPRLSDLTEKVVVSAGRLHPHKNYPLLIEAFALVVKEHPDWSLHIYGDGVQHDDLQGLIDEKGIGENVRLMGLRHDMATVMSQASIFALTSLHEGFGLALLEALACGLPVVATYTAGTDEIMKGYGCGYLAKQGDPADIAMKINDLIERPEKRKLLQQNAIKRANDFNLDKVIGMWEELFSSLVNKEQ